MADGEDQLVGVRGLDGSGDDEVDDPEVVWVVLVGAHGFAADELGGRRPDAAQVVEVDSSDCRVVRDDLHLELALQRSLEPVEPDLVATLLVHPLVLPAGGSRVGPLEEAVTESDQEVIEAIPLRRVHLPASLEFNPDHGQSNDDERTGQVELHLEKLGSVSILGPRAERGLINWVGSVRVWAHEGAPLAPKGGMSVLLKLTFHECNKSSMFELLYYTYVSLACSKHSGLALPSFATQAREKPCIAKSKTLNKILQWSLLSVHF